MKKLISIVLAFAVLSTFVLPCFAVSALNNDGELYTYIDTDGKLYDYYLDEDGNAYNYVDGEKIYMLLPLPQYRITDEETLAELNEDFSMRTRGTSMPEPTEYFDISNVNGLEGSPAYVKDVSFDNFQTFTTPWIKISSKHNFIRFRTTKVRPILCLNKKVYIAVRIYDTTTKEWSQFVYKSIDCTGTNGQPFQYVSSQRYCKFVLGIPEKVTSYTANIWTTYIDKVG